ncbi:MAG: Hsp20/alpha crystallin family protein [Desulfovibrio sp.]|jgi:HSP20 family protein|nr:Hsp20/alpha crystallin family protein [Desulfovibrio sp.]
MPTFYTPRKWVKAHPDQNAAGEQGRERGYATVARLHNDIDSLFDGFISPWLDFDLLGRRNLKPSAAGTVTPRLDVHSDDQKYTITAELPGVSMSDVSLEVKENTLHLRGEKKVESEEEKKDYHISERMYGSFERALSLPEDAVVDAIKASQKDGVLTVTIPRKQPEKAATRSITIDQG